MEDLTGKTLGNYRLVERIGRGGMAVVYKAYQPALERHVAIKVIRGHLVADDEQFLKRFQREAKAVASLRHPNIVQVFDFGTEDDVSYMVMEFLDGVTLKAQLNELAGRGETMPLGEVQRIFQDVASAVGYAHSQGMVHRDIKPANVMLTTKGEVVLTDFGIARIVGAEQYTATGAVVGTPAYLSPEQGKGERGDERSDIYALGVVLYEMVTGRVPFDADTPLAVIFKHISDPLPLPRQLNPDLPDAVEQIILKAMAKEPGDRYQVVDEMADALADAILPQGETWQTGEGWVESDGIEQPEGVVHDLEASAADEAVPQRADFSSPPRRKKSTAPSTQALRFSPRAWRGIALFMFLIAISWGVCGLLAGNIPSEPTENMPNPESTNFWITRGCFVGPAFALIFLAYLAFMAGRRKRSVVHFSELAAALGAAFGLLPMLLGLAMIFQPEADRGDRTFAPLCCLLPGLFIVGLAGIFWAFVARGKREAVVRELDIS